MLKWNQRLTAELQARLAPAVVRIGLEIEGEARRELHPSAQDDAGNWIEGGGRGKRSGTLQRSIHAASVGYNFAGDDVTPSNSSPDRGGQAPEPERDGDRLMVAVGSGMVYAMAVHQGHGSFGGYHYLTNAVEKVRPKALAIIRKHVGA